MPEEKEKYFRFQAKGNNFEAELEMCNMDTVEIVACIAGMLSTLVKQGHLDAVDLGFMLLAVKHDLEKEGKEEDGD